MKLKSIFILLVIVMTMFSIEQGYSQGFFKNNTPETEENKTTTGSSNNMRAPGGGITDGEDNPLDNPTPVGEGLVILSLLSGGYFMIKKKNSQKN